MRKAEEVLPEAKWDFAGQSLFCFFCILRKSLETVRDIPLSQTVCFQPVHKSRLPAADSERPDLELCNGQK